MFVDLGRAYQIWIKEPKFDHSHSKIIGHNGYKYV